MKIVAFVPIKLNNQRFPNKNILPLNDKPLCYHIFETLKGCPKIDQIYVYCSDPAIKQYIPTDITYMKRPAKLDSDETKGLEIYKEFISIVDADYYILAHATSPFISSKSINLGISALEEGHDSALSVLKYQTFVWYKDTPLNYNLNDVKRTQDLEPIYLETSGFYMFKKELIFENRRIGYHPKMIEVSCIEAIDIDHSTDYLLARSMNKIPQKEQ